jgi:hypothetical protein
LDWGPEARQLALQARHICVDALQRAAQLHHTLLVFLGLSVLISSALWLAVVPLSQQLSLLLFGTLQLGLQHRLGLHVALTLVCTVYFCSTCT